MLTSNLSNPKAAFLQKALYTIALIISYEWSDFDITSFPHMHRAHLLGSGFLSCGFQKSLLVITASRASYLPSWLFLTSRLSLLQMLVIADNSGIF